MELADGEMVGALLGPVVGGAGATEAREWSVVHAQTSLTVGLAQLAGNVVYMPAGTKK